MSAVKLPIMSLEEYRIFSAIRSTKAKTSAALIRVMEIREARSKVEKGAAQ